MILLFSNLILIPSAGYLLSTFSDTFIFHLSDFIVLYHGTGVHFLLFIKFDTEINEKTRFF